MRAKPRLFVADYRGYARPFLQTFDVVDSIKHADVLMFTGGEDVDPKTYGQKPGKHTYFSERDRYELEFFNVAQSKDMPIIGICRGHQLLCALSGGTLVQHVTGHGRGHEILTDDGEKYVMSSLHHQMVRLEDTGARLIAWSNPSLSSCYLGQDNEELYGHELFKADDEDNTTKPISRHVEPEIVYWSKVKGLGIQGHPEMMAVDSPTVQYCNRLVKEYLLGEAIKVAA